MRVLSDETIAKIQRLAFRNSDAEIAKALGIAVPTAGKYADYFRRGKEPPEAKVGLTRLLPLEKREQVRALVRVGASKRQISLQVGIAMQTALKWSHIYRDEAPNCKHGINIYRCNKCLSGRRHHNGETFTIHHGPKKPHEQVT